MTLKKNLSKKSKKNKNNRNRYLLLDRKECKLSLLMNAKVTKVEKQGRVNSRRQSCSEMITVLQLLTNILY